MYYFKVAISAVFVIEFFISLFYLLLLSTKIATHLIERKEAMKKSFIVSFLSFMFMFIVYLIWQDLSNLSLWSWTMRIILTTGFSLFVGLIFSAALWNWKNKA
jgi:protein-S-isoprenylcysteine O-methyltransferase Ste14